MLLLGTCFMRKKKKKSSSKMDGYPAVDRITQAFSLKARHVYAITVK